MVAWTLWEKVGPGNQSPTTAAFTRGLVSALCRLYARVYELGHLFWFGECNYVFFGAVISAYTCSFAERKAMAHTQPPSEAATLAGVKGKKGSRHGRGPQGRLPARTGKRKTGLVYHGGLNTHQYYGPAFLKCSSSIIGLK